MEYKNNNETITMTMADFKKIIEEEVKRQVSEPVIKNQLFPSPSILSGSLEQVNKSNGKVNQLIYNEVLADEHFPTSHIDWLGRRTPMSKAEIEKSTKAHYKYKSVYGAKRTFSEQNTHDLLRKLSLAVYGMTINSDATNLEFGYLKEYYDEFLKLFITFYEERLKREFGVD